MAALYGCSIDNVIIEINGPEVPIMDGSSAPFVFLIESSGILEQSLARKSLVVLKEVSVEHNGGTSTLSPAENFSLSFDFASPDRKGMSEDTFTFYPASGNFKLDIARARTFGFYEDIEKLRAHGLARGGSLDNAIVIQDGKVLNEEGLRYNNELVRHKMLDVLGDLYLVGHPIIGHFHAYRGGHTLNNLLLKALLSDPTAYEIREVKPRITATSEQA